MSEQTPRFNKNEAVVEDKRSLAFPTRTLDPAYTLVDRAKEIEQAEQSIESHVHGKLDVIVDQIRSLKEQAREIMEQAQRDVQLHQVKCNFEKMIGQPIHLYEKEDGALYFSLLSPADWKGNPPNRFRGSYALQADRSFEVIEEVEVETEAASEDTAAPEPEAGR